MKTERWDPFEGRIELPDPQPRENDYIRPPRRRGFDNTIEMGIAITVLFVAASYISDKTAGGTHVTVGFLAGMFFLVGLIFFRSLRKGKTVEANFTQMLAPASIMRTVAIERHWSMRPGFAPMRIVRLSRYAPEVSARVRISDMNASERALFGAELWGMGSQGEPFWAGVSGYKTRRMMNVVIIAKLSGKIGRRVVIKPQYSKPSDDIEVESVEFNDLFVVRQMRLTGEEASDGLLEDRLHHVFRALSPAVIEQLIELSRGSETIMVADGELMTFSVRLSYSDSASEVGRQLQASIEAGTRLATLLS